MRKISTAMLAMALTLGLAGGALAYEAFHGPLGVLQKNEGVTDGYVLLAPQGSKTTYLLDNDGNVVREWVSEHSCFYAELRPNGNLVRHSTPDGWWPNFGGSGGLIEEWDFEGNKVFEYQMYEPGQMILHHTFEIMPNGNLLLLGWEMKPFEEAVAKGLDTTDPNRLLTADGFRSGQQMIQGIWPDFVREIDQSGNTVWEWHLWDHIGTGPNQWDINKYCPAIAFFPTMKFSQFPGPDWSHFNGIAYREATNQLCITSRNLGEVYIIDKATGEMVYRWGNPANYGAGRAPGGYADNGDQQLFGPHAPDWTPEGNITILDNGTVRPSHNYTRAVELNPATGEVVWEWGPHSVNAQPNNFYSSFQCGAQKLANGNWMITTTSPGHIVEVTNDKNIVWEFVNPVQADQIYAVSNRHGGNGDGVHKALRYARDWPGFAGKDMTPLYQFPNWVEALSTNVRP